ncbi:MAG: hypothetical protein WC071_12165 [Victivallaceae bacterium]
MDANETYSKNDFSFNIFEFIKYYYSNKTIIIISIVCMALLGYFIAEKFFSPTYSASIEVEINSTGIETGKNPDGTAFSPNQLIAPIVMEKTCIAVNKLFNTDKFKNMNQYISVEPVIPWLIMNQKALAEKNKQDFTYNPVKWKISFTINQKDQNKFSKPEIMRYLEELVANYKLDYINRYCKAQIAAIAVAERLATAPLGPREKVMCLEDFSNSVINAIKTTAPKSGYVSKDGKSFNMVESYLINLNKNSMPKLLSAATRLMIVPYPEIYIMELEDRHRNFQLQAKMAAAEAMAAEKLLNEMQKSKTMGGTEVNLRGAEVKFDGSLIDYVKKSDMQLLLIQKALLSRAEEGKFIVQSEDVLRMIKEFSDTRESAERKKQETDLNKSINQTINEVIYLSNIANHVYSEYASQISGSAITITDRLPVTGEYKTMLKIILAMILIPVLLTAFLAFSDQWLKNKH